MRWYYCVLMTFNLSITCFPKISIITSIYKGDLFIENFLADIVQQSIFDQCELLLVDANSPGNEKKYIDKYLEKYSNIIYTKLDYDPGLYGVWNIGIKQARGFYITNANLDDRLKHDCYEVFSKFLDENPQVDLVYSSFYITQKANETFSQTSSKQVVQMPDFSKINMFLSLPNCYPMWRKKLHAKCGLFNEQYKIVGDWEMWLRMVSMDAFFKKIPGQYCLYYINPKGLSVDNNNNMLKLAETREVFSKYKNIIGPNESIESFFKKIADAWKTLLYAPRA